MRGFLWTAVCCCLAAGWTSPAAGQQQQQAPLPTLADLDSFMSMMSQQPAAPAPAAHAPFATPPAPAGGDAKPDATSCDENKDAKCPDDSKPDNFFKQGDYKFQIGGQYRVNPNFSNFPFQPVTLSPVDESGTNFAQQRLRVWLTAVIDEHTEGYVQVQIGGFLWGQNYEFSKSFVGPRFPLTDDHVGILLRRGWVSYHDDDCGKFRVGILDWHDSFGDTLASSDYDFNVAGIDWTKTFPELCDLKVWLGAFVLTDLALLESDLPPGNHDAFLLTSDFDWKLDEKTTVGFSVYGLSDDGQYSYPTLTPYRSAWDIWVGARGATCLGVVPVNGFLLYNGGQRMDVDGAFFEHNGWASKIGLGPIELGPGKLSTEALYATGSHHPEVGNSDEFRTIGQAYRDNFGAQGYWGYLYITAPNPPSDVKDLGVSLQNRGLGLFTVQGKFEYPLTWKLSGILAAGWSTAAQPNPVNGGRVIGPELAHQYAYNFGHGLTFDIGAAVLFTGGFYRAGPIGPAPNNLIEVFSRVQLEY